MSSNKRPASPEEKGVSTDAHGNDGAGPSKKARPSQPPSLHSWLHPDEPAPLRTHSPPLHYSSSTFLSFAISFLPGSHITTEASLAKEARRVVRELNVPTEVGELVMKDDEGAFESGEGRVVSLKGKERAREPDHRMWAVRTLCLKEGKDGTKGSDDYQLLETYNDDGEKFGGERVLKILKEEGAIDVLVICCRWYGGDMIGPIRFQHIGLTAKTALTALLKLTRLRDLRQALMALDEEITSLRQGLRTMNGGGADPPSSASQSSPLSGDGRPKTMTYEGVEDPMKLERLVKAREKTKSVLESRISWAGSEAAQAGSIG